MVSAFEAASIGGIQDQQDTRHHFNISLITCSSPHDTPTLQLHPPFGPTGKPKRASAEFILYQTDGRSYTAERLWNHHELHHSCQHSRQPPLRLVEPARSHCQDI